MTTLITDPAWGDGVLFIALIPFAIVVVLVFDTLITWARNRLEQRRLRRARSGAAAVSPRPELFVSQQRGRLVHRPKP